MTNHTRNHGLRIAAENRLRACLRDFRHDGATVAEILDYLGLGIGGQTRMRCRLRDLIAAGHAGAHSEGVEIGHPRLRYWDAEFLPQTWGQVEKVKPPEEGAVAAHRTGPLDRPWATLPAGYVSALNPAQCRPWALSAAAAIEGRG